VVWNLCDNAIKYGEAADGISVEIKVEPLNPSTGPFWKSPIAGRASKPQVVDRIFEPFFTGRKGGTGLGLFIARELCQLNRAVLLYEPRGRRRQRFQNRVQRSAAMGGIAQPFARLTLQ
jgi:two-component system sensor histidine kinase PilS (NtrC family)